MDKEKEEINVYAVKHKNLNTRMNSRSGGAFTAISDLILEENGIVYGCVLTKDFRAKHIRAKTKEERNLMRGSKYIQSDLGDVFLNVKKDLEAKRKVLFSGTSCQVAGLKTFLQKEYDNLLCVDIVCHGVPSTKVWEKYLKWQERKNKSKCVSVDFRNKKDFGWSAHVETLYLKNADGIKKQINSEIFKNIYFSHLILRPACYQCPYKSVNHPGDITIADYWGIEKAAPGFSDNKGVSLVLINNKLGRNVFKQIQNDIDFKKCRMEDSMRTTFIRPFSKPENRERFWKDYNKYPFDKIVKKYGGQNLKSKIKRKIKSLLKR